MSSRPAAGALPPASTTIVGPDGDPAFGTYRGPFAIVDLRALRPPHARGALGRLQHHKKWVYAYASDDSVSVLCAIVDIGYASNAFVTVTDMATGTVLADRSVLGGPGPLARVGDHPAIGLRASFDSPLGRFGIVRPAHRDPYRLTVDAGGLTEALGAAPRAASGLVGTLLGRMPVAGPRLRGVLPGSRSRPDSPAASAGPTEHGDSGRVRVDLSFDAGRTPELSVVAPVQLGGGSVNVTQKVAGLPVTGTVSVGERSWQLRSAVGGLDYTHGYLARHTAWNWAFMVGRLADSSRVGLNLVAGFSESRSDVNENALWIDDRLIPLDRARFTWDKSDPRVPWTVRTVDGSVDLTFTPYAVHSERKDLVVLTSRFLQPIGVFSGTLRVDGTEIAVEAVPGVTEDQDIRW